MALFTDVAQAAGVRFTHANGDAGKLYFVEVTPAGCAFVDYDDDGFLDIVLVQSGSSEPPTSKSGLRPHCALLHNDGHGAFVDATAGSGLDKDLGYGHGVAVGDYDNDGYDDLFLTSYRGNHLFHNDHGSGKFTEVTARMGLDRVHDTGYAVSAAFGDYDNDGRLDLFVCYYCPWTWAIDRKCDGDYCNPALYQRMSSRLYHNDGGRFTDVSARMGIDKVTGHALAVSFLDYNEDGKQDIFVANDLTGNTLWRNEGTTFTDAATEAGCAYSENGELMAGMGIGLADYDHSGRESLFVTNYSEMPNTLFHNTGGLYEDRSIASGLAVPHLKYLAFGCEFLDYDADGWADLIAANGHVRKTPTRKRPEITFAERKQLFHNSGNGTFAEITDPAALGGLALPTVARGLATGDFDNDGRVDVLVNSQNAPAQLFHNDDHSANHWIAFKTVGVKSNRDGYHAHFAITAGGVQQTATVHAGSSYLSHSDSRVYFGLGGAAKVDRVQIHWPSGATDTLKDLPADGAYIVTEGRGITGKQAAAAHSPS
jgi:hypothetical protein